MVISPYISTFIKSLAMINYVCIYIIKMHLSDNYNAEYFTNNYNAESITSVEKMNYHRWTQQNASIGVTCALLLTSHFSMFEVRACSNVIATVKFFAIFMLYYFFSRKMFYRISGTNPCIKLLHWCQVNFYRSMRPYFNRIDIGICAEIIWAFPLNSFHFCTLLFWVSFFLQCLLFLALFTSSLFDIASYSNDLCSILGVFLLFLIYFRIIQLYLRHSIEIKQIDLFLLVFFFKHVSYIDFAIISNNKTNERKLKIVSLLSNLSAVISFT